MRRFSARTASFEVSYWIDDYWRYALYAAIALIRASAAKTGQSVPDLADKMAKFHNLDLSRQPADSTRPPEPRARSRAGVIGCWQCSSTHVLDRGGSPAVLMPWVRAIIEHLRSGCSIVRQ